jgi:molybdopterin/thiamine biosynthesis adenylyltransferase
LEERYQRMIPALSPEELLRLRESRVLVAGCGGLGGYLIEYLVRLGVGHITAADGDVFEASNLNRQILSDTAHIGSLKALAAKERAAGVNPDSEVIPVCEFLTEENADRLLKGQDLALDALDYFSARKILASACAKAGIYMVHGGIQGWCAQVCVISPGSGVLDRISPADEEDPDRSSLSFVPAFCASVQAAEAVKILCGRKPELENKLLAADLDVCEIQVFDL